MFKCNDCGNTEAFLYEVTEAVKVWFNPGSSDVLDSKSMEVINEELVACADCYSEDIEGK